MSEAAAEPLPEKRDGTGNEVGPGKPPAEHQFKKGRSGNPGGRPKGLAKAVRDVPVEMGQGDGAVLLSKFLWSIIGNKEWEHPLQLQAVRMLAERGWGKPAEFVPIESDDPLGLAEADAAVVADELRARMDELAAKRAERAAAVGE